jgi:hypothetical protein
MDADGGPGGLVDPLLAIDILGVELAARQVSVGMI